MLLYIHQMLCVLDIENILLGCDFALNSSLHIHSLLAPLELEVSISPKCGLRGLTGVRGGR